MQIDLTQIIVALIGVLAAVITKFAIPYLTSKVGAEKRQEIAFWAKLAVEAAEKIFKEQGMGSAKKEYVKTFLEEKGFKLDDKEIDIAIESAVLEMQNAIAG